MSELLRVDEVHRRFRGHTVLSGVSLRLGAGDTVGLVGVSGAGKSTLLRLVAGLDRPNDGTVSLDGGPVRRPRREVQTVAQDPRSALDPRWTVRRSVAEPLLAWRRDLGRAGRRDRVRRLLEQVHLDPGLADRYPHELSTGQCQRVCLARALAPEPDLLLLDEPLSALDLPVQARMLDLLREVRSTTGTACLFVSHDIVLVSAFCDRILVLHDGRIVEEVPAARLLTGAVHPHTRALVRDTPRPPVIRAQRGDPRNAR